MLPSLFRRFGVIGHEKKSTKNRLWAAFVEKDLSSFSKIHILILSHDLFAGVRLRLIFLTLIHHCPQATHTVAILRLPEKIKPQMIFNHFWGFRSCQLKEFLLEESIMVCKMYWVSDLKGADLYQAADDFQQMTSWFSFERNQFNCLCLFFYIASSRITVLLYFLYRVVSL